MRFVRFGAGLLARYQGPISPSNLGGGLDSSRLSTRRALSPCERKFALGLEQARFDRTGTAKSPQEVCQPMNERKLDCCSRIDTADE